ncbi:protein-L-isoaspartate(D-aspartate) O-methyltransferase [Candidatus Dojkabacteria bacterium]|nr:protein-L-isoaspartate(D-aspartate) O-methyltransferase [Candidatus Dojkabacteria bacterium]
MSTGYEQLIDDLKKMGYLKTPGIIDAFRKYERKYFVPKSLAYVANVNRPLPIGSGQTISQPLTVAFMIEMLEPKEGHKILEIGGGSGWQTAILSEIVGPKGKVFAFEIVKFLADFGKENISRFKLKNVTFEHKDVSEGYPKEAPFDRIISGAAFEKIPQSLKEQLKVNGILVAPTQEDDIRKITRISKTKFDEKIIPGFVFVPVTKNDS